MADNETTQSATLATLPAGVTYAFDELTGGVKVARSKTGFGEDGSYTDVSASNPLPVTAASLPLPSGAATSAKQDTAAAILTTIDADTGAIAAAAATLAGAVAGTEMQVDVVGALPAGSNNIGDVDIASTVLPVLNSTAAVTSVADTASSTTLLSSSGTRKGFRITNTSSAVLYVKYGTTASATDFTARLPQWAYLEENHYAGRVDGIWATDPGDGAALITSLSA